jgi:hypothetical protein
MRPSRITSLATAKQLKTSLPWTLALITLCCFETCSYGQAIRSRTGSKTPPTYSIQQFKKKVNGQFGLLGNQPLTHYLVHYVGSTKDFHYFETFGDKNPYYRVARQQLPKLVLANGNVIEFPKDQVDREYRIGKDLNLILGPPGFSFKKIELDEVAKHSIKLEFSEARGVTTIQVEAPIVHPQETGLQLSGISILHTEFAPRQVPLKNPQANIKQATFKVATAELKNSRLRLVFATLPGGNAYDIPLDKAGRIK